ncbi:MAG: DUF5658 family protein [Candidatus Methanomethyliaceae archaeon]
MIKVFNVAPKDASLRQKRLLSLLILAFSALDAGLTQRGLKLGYLGEANPIVNLALQAQPPPYVWGIKLFFAVLWGFLLSFFEVPAWVNKAAIAVTGILALVIFLHWNIILGVW